MSLVGGGVQCIECVNGDGKTVRSLRALLVECANRLPFMGESIPKGWVTLKEKVQNTMWQSMIVSEECTEMRRLLEELSLPVKQVWEGLRFWELLGYVIVHQKELIPNPTALIDLSRPLVHHAPLQSLETQLKRSNAIAEAADIMRSEDWVSLKSLPEILFRRNGLLLHLLRPADFAQSIRLF